MNLAMIDLLDTKSNAVNAIMAIDLETKKVVRQNQLSADYFYQREGATDLKKLFGEDTDKDEFIQGVLVELEDNDKAVISGTTVQGKTGDEVECHLTFSYLNDEYSHLLLKVHPIIDNKPYYMEKFIETRTRPAFTLNVKDNLSINQANDVFYKSFACNEESLKIIYRNMFVNLLAQDSRQDYEKQILDAIDENHYAIVEIPIKTARGETLWLYFNKRKLRPVEDKENPSLFCLLVSREDTLADIDNPFDNG